MDASNPNATTAEEFLGGTPSWRTDLYTGRASVVTLKESIQLTGRHRPDRRPANPRALAR
jgi:glycerophosphoryl diester phosphodiesterase